MGLESPKPSNPFKSAFTQATKQPTESPRSFRRPVEGANPTEITLNSSIWWWAMGDLPPAVEAVLQQLLPRYQADRERWPYWTYCRVGYEPVDASQFGDLVESSGGSWTGDLFAIPETIGATRTWVGQRTAKGELRWSWAGRLRWSALLPILAVMSDLDRMARNAGLMLVSPGVGGSETGFRVEDGEGEESDVPIGFVPGARSIYLRGDDDWVRADVPLSLQARTAATFAATAPTAVPSTASDVRVPRAYRRRGFLDDHDFDELLSCVGMALLRGFPPLLSRFLRRQHEIAKPAAQRPEGWEDLNRERFNQLAGEVLRHAGLFPRTQGGTGDKIRAPLIDHLMEEAEAIVEAVRACKRDGLDGLDVLFETEGDDANPHAREKLGLQLRFPFLTLIEIRVIRCEVEISAVSDEELAQSFPFLEEEERAMLYGKGTTIHRAASMLMRHRLPGSLGYDALQKRLS